MSTNNGDNQDKTVFRQPINRGDGTVVRPIPGGRVPNAQPAQRAPYSQPVQPENAPYQATDRVGRSDISNFSANVGLNPLVNAAATLLAVFSKTRESLNYANVAHLSQQLDREIRSFESNARVAGINEEKVIIARYILCTILDEAVLNTPWGAESAWNQRTLLSNFHNETAGGEKFFDILDRLRHSPSENIETLELIYICLSLGYEGKYRVLPRGRDNLEQLRDELFHLIRNYRGDYERALSPCWQGVGHTGNKLSTYLPMWVVASFVLGLMALTYSGIRYALHQSSANVSQQLIEVADEKPAKEHHSSLNKSY